MLKIVVELSIEEKKGLLYEALCLYVRVIITNKYKYNKNTWLNLFIIQ